MLAPNITQLITDIGDIKDDLTSLRDDLWLDIDHTDPQSIAKGSERMVAFIAASNAFSKVADDLIANVRPFLGNSAGASEAELVDQVEMASSAKIQMQISFDESWTYRRPAGFSLRGKYFRGLNTWSKLYERLLHVLHETDAGVFQSLPDRSVFISNHGNPYISREKSQLRDPLALPNGVFAEMNLNANLIRNNIKFAIAAFSIPDSDIEILLRK